MARWAVAVEPRSPGRSGGWPGGGLKSPARALVMASPHVRAPCVRCATTSPTVHPAHALGLDHSSGLRPAKKSCSWDASALLNSITSVMAVVRITLHEWREIAQAPLGCLPNRERRHGRSPLAMRLLAAAFILEEVTTGGQPRQMVPHLAGVLTSWYRGNDRAKEAALTVDRDHRHAKGPHPLDPVLVFGEDTLFHPWLGCRLGAPGRLKARLAQGTFDHRWISKRFLTLVAGTAESEIEAINRLIAEALTRPCQQGKS